MKEIFINKKDNISRSSMFRAKIKQEAKNKKNETPKKNKIPLKIEENTNIKKDNGREPGE